MELIELILEGLKVGGPWALVIALSIAVVRLYADLQRNHKAALDRTINIVEAQTAANTKMEATLSTARDLILTMIPHK